LPGPWKLLVTAPGRYLRPSHHPNNEASTQMAIDYLEYSPVAKAARERARSQGKQSGGPDSSRGITSSDEAAGGARVR
jgi:hypothetical protein